MRFAYADPPYLGCGAKHYGHQHPDAADWDSLDTHRALITRLHAEYDGWALSLSSTSLEDMLILCREVVGPNVVRIGGWFKPFASFKKGVNPAYAWEPVIFTGQRSASARGGKAAPTARDWVIANITMQRGTSGAKPEAFSLWLFFLLGMQFDDEFHDLFPGSGAVSRVWKDWQWHNSAREA